MADRPMETDGPEDPALAIAARHALHDEELIAAFATDGDVVDGAERARSFVERCVACRALHADLVAIGGVLRAVEKAESVAGTQPAPRDFRLSIETANRLRPGSVALKLSDRLAAAVGSFSRPVGLSLASFGVVGLVLGTLTMGGFTNLTSAPEDNGGTGAAAAPTGVPGEVTGPAGTRLESMRVSFDALATASPPTAEPVPGQGPLSTGGPTLPALIVGGSAILLIGGIALLVVGSRRREPVPDH